MRPLALRLEAFGSYAGVLEIDFARLGRHGVFSITGPTGAGKSTIFDAIVYALYDDLPGFRTDSHVRSQFADPGTGTSVRLTFEADGTEWTVERWPAQPRPRKRGDGVPVVDESRVVLREAGADGGGITRKAQVADRLVRLVGLTKAQFEQVVLIPQGKFEEVLKAETKDRAELLSRLFPVDVFRRTTDALKEVAGQRRADYEDRRASGAALVEQIRCDVLDAFAMAPDGCPVPEADDPSLTPDGFDPGALDDLRAAIAAMAAVIEHARTVARTDLDGARIRRQEAEALAGRWDQWQADLMAARGFPDQVAEDAAILEGLDRARTVARMGQALEHWRTATDTVAEAGAEARRLRMAIEQAWPGGYDRGALDRPGDAALLAARMTSDAEALEAADRARHELVARDRELGRAEEASVDRERAAAAAAEDLTTIDTRLTAVRGELAVADAASSGRGDAEVLVRRLEHELAAATRRAVALAEVETVTRDLSGATQDEDLAAAQVIDLRSVWRAGLAGRLAGHLVDGAPCPTCGALEHPDPARPAADAPTDDTLAEAEDRLRRSVEVCQALRVALATARANADSAGAEVTERPLAHDPDALRALLEDARVALDAARTADAEAARLRDAIDALTQDRTDRHDAVTRDSEALLVDRATIRTRRQQWEQDRDAFIATHGAMEPMAPTIAALWSVAAMVGTLTKVLERARDAERAVTQGLASLTPVVAEFGVDGPADLEVWARAAADIDEEARAVAARTEQRRTVESRLRDYTEGGGPPERPDSAAFAAIERSCNERHDDLVGRHAVVTSRIAAIDAARTELSTRTQALAEARVLKEEAETLHAACAGLGGGPAGARVSLHNWVLAYYLRQVLAQANVRLDAMTAGRFALELDQVSTDGRKASGLDLSVLDAETGQTRPATTLSGGETFMAALSLALGLADVVSAGSNYRIGALFVDEGFGSLDGESLDTVIDVLRSLQDGGRMVGVISHVQDLKDALPNGITIESTSQGSRAAIHYPEP